MCFTIYVMDNQSTVCGRFDRETKFKFTMFDTTTKENIALVSFLLQDEKEFVLLMLATVTGNWTSTMLLIWDLLKSKKKELSSWKPPCHVINELSTSSRPHFQNHTFLLQFLFRPYPLAYNGYLSDRLRRPD